MPSRKILHSIYRTQQNLVQTDASNVNGTGRVFQKGDQGNELLMVCSSRTFTRAECKYGTFRKEILALGKRLVSFNPRAKEAAAGSQESRGMQNRTYSAGV